MKQFFRFFTLLAVAVVTSVSAWAIEIPKPNAVAPSIGNEYYILNVGTGKFVGQGEAWGTQACAVDKGLKFSLLNAKEDGSSIGVDADGNDVYELPTGQYWLNSGSSLTIARWATDPNVGQGVKSCFTDQGFGTIAAIWQLESVGNNTYTIQTPSSYNFETNGAETEFVDGEFLGVQLDHQSGTAVDGVTYGLYFDVVYDNAPEMCQYQFLPAEKMAAYDKKLELAALIDQAKELGVSTTAAEAVIANLDATEDEVQAAIDELTEALKNADQYQFPDDVTDQYITPSIPLPNNYDGWTMYDGEGQPVNFVCNYDANEQIGELWQKGGYSIKYTIKNLPAGVYTLRVQGWTRNNMNSVIKAGDVEKKLITVGFNSRGEGRKKLDAGELVNDLKFIQKEAGDVEISLTADNVTSDYWTCWSKWSLLSHGDGVETYKKMANDVVKDWEKEFVDVDEETGMTTPKKPFTQTYFDAIDNIAKSFDGMTSKDQVEGGLNNFYTSVQTLRDNIALYEKLQGYVEQDAEELWNEYGGYTPFVNVFNEAEAIFTGEDYTKTNEQLQDLIDRYLNLRKEAKEQTLDDYPVGSDVSAMIENRRFKTEDGKESSFDGWTVASSSWFENNAGSLSVVEQWANGSEMGVIDVYQEIAPKKVGVYVLKSKGWYRSTNIPVRRENPGYNTVNTYLYGASSEYAFHDIYDHLYSPEEKVTYFPKGAYFNATHPDDKSVVGYGISGDTTEEDYIAEMESKGDEQVAPQNPTAADELFNNPEVTWYDMECRFLGLGSDTPIKIGVRGRDIPPYAWLIWDDFQLIYESDKLEDMAEVAADVASDAQEDVDGLMWQQAKENLQECIDGLENPETVDQLIDCYKRIDAAREAARASKKLYQQMQDKLDELNEALVDYAKTATADAYDAADALSVEVDGGIQAGSIADEDVPAILKSMNEAIARLRIPDATDASDSNPIDFTSVITNPTYFDGDAIAATWEGWTDGGGFNANNNVQLVQDAIGLAEGWARSFDVYQDLVGLPEGTYEVRVSGLFRQNTYPKDAKLSQYEYAVKIGKEDALGEEATTDLLEREFRGKFYANSDTASFKRWNFMGTDEWNEDAESDFNVQAVSGDWTFKDSLTIGSEEDQIIEYYFPADRAGAYERFLQGWYENVLYAYVSDNGKLRIGACNKEAVESDWVTFTNWRLFYHGTESIYEEGTGIHELETEGKAVVDGIYTVDGRKAEKLQKGMNIVVSDGKARKIMVK